MPPSKRHCTGNLQPAFSGQLAGIRVAEDSVGALALLRAVHCHPKRGIGNVAYWGRRVHTRIIPVSKQVSRECVRRATVDENRRFAHHLNSPVAMLTE